MDFPAGFRLGSYEIVSPLGAGGMGEVYRAHDSRLGRDVAVKVLPPRLAADPEALARFQREARAVAALSHPGILAIHEFGAYEGTTFAVMELLEGETLRARIGGRFPVRRAIDYAVQIAQALAAAHDKGVVHRDLKPENIFVTRDGRIKVLDFGLAKLLPVRGDTGITAQMESDTGLILGTAGYMSPEQVRADAVDHRADIFALGAVLYEMVSGVRAFHAGSAVETMTAIVREDPPEWPSDCQVPLALDRIVRHCMEKDPGQRFQSARDLAFDLQTISFTTMTTRQRSVPRRIPWKSVALLLLAAAGCAAAFLFGRATASPASRPPTWRRVTFQRGDVLSARFAPDGQTLAYGAAWEGEPAAVFSGRVDSPESRPLGFQGATVLAISTSGEMALSLALGPEGGTLARAPLSGGAARELMEHVRFADWSPDGRELAVTRWEQGRNRLEYPAGSLLFEAAGWIEGPRVAPDGEQVAFVDHPIRADTTGSVMVVKRGQTARVLSGPWASIGGLAWTPAGDEVWFTAATEGSGRSLHAVDLRGRVRSIASAPGRLVLQDIARDGRVLVSHPSLRSGIAGLVGDAPVERNLSALDYSRSASLSADGSLLLFDEGGDGSRGDYAVYLRRTDGAPPVRLGEGAAQALSPDGRFALALVSREARLVLLPTRAGAPRTLDLGGVVPQAGALFMPDGESILFSGAPPGRAVRSYVLPLDGGAAQPVTPEGQIALVLAPDGRAVGARGTPSGFWVVPLGAGESRRVPGIDAQLDVPIAFTPDSRGLYFFRAGGMPTRVDRVDTVTGERTPWRELRVADPAGVSGISRVQIAADGRSYVYTYRRVLADLFVIEGLR